jgi:hypothetical protein
MYIALVYHVYVDHVDANSGDHWLGNSPSDENDVTPREFQEGLYGGFENGKNVNQGNKLIKCAFGNMYELFI